jgi:hypothetical protein
MDTASVSAIVGSAAGILGVLAGSVIQHRFARQREAEAHDRVSKEKFANELAQLYADALTVVYRWGELVFLGTHNDRPLEIADYDKLEMSKCFARLKLTSTEAIAEQWALVQRETCLRTRTGETLATWVSDVNKLVEMMAEHVNQLRGKHEADKA